MHERPSKTDYKRPQLSRYGTFRDITQQGFGAVADGGFIIGDDGSVTPAGDGSR